MVTFNHAAYVAQAIESVLAQVTDFDVELVIGEDDSTDNTRQIVQAYQRQHPERIRLLLHPRNVGAQANVLATLQACRGEYVALLEGDDYWIDPDKLQAQVALLDANPAAFLCGARALVWPDGAESSSAIVPAEDSETLASFGARELFEDRWWFRTCTKMFRRSATQKVPAQFAGDWSAIMWLIANSNFGPVCFLDRVVAVYRTHPAGVWTSMPRRARLERDIVTLFRLIPLFRSPEREQLHSRMDAYAHELTDADGGSRLAAVRCATLTVLRSRADRAAWRQFFRRVRSIARRRPTRA